MDVYGMRNIEGIADMDVYGLRCIQSGRSGSPPIPIDWIEESATFKARPPTHPRASLTEITAVKRELKAWRYPPVAHWAVQRVLLSLDYCAWNPGERLGQIALAKDAAALATAVGRSWEVTGRRAHHVSFD